MNALNALPGVGLHGEIYGIFGRAVEMYRWAVTRGLAGYDDLRAQREELRCLMQGYFLRLRPSVRSHGSRPQPTIVGFKELLLHLGWTKEGKWPQTVSAFDKQLPPFFNVLFPHARFIFSTREDVREQARSQARLAFKRRNASDPEHARIIADLTAENDELWAWHQRLRPANRSRWLPLPAGGFETRQFDEIAAWLGMPHCRFLSVPNSNRLVVRTRLVRNATTNEKRNNTSPGFASDLENVRVECRARRDGYKVR